MENYSLGHQDQEDQGGHPDQQMTSTYGFILPYEDPAIINPDELASFPKPNQAYSYHHHHEHDSHLVNKRTPVRDGRNITRTDNHPDKNGFM